MTPSNNFDYATTIVVNSHTAGYIKILNIKKNFTTVGSNNVKVKFEMTKGDFST